MNSQTILMLAVVVLGVPLLLVGYITLSERLLGSAAHKRSSSVRAIFWIAPAVVLLVVFLVYPIITTIILSLKDAASRGYVGLANYKYVFTDRNMLLVLRNNLLWLVLFTLVTLTFGLLIALLADRVKYEAVAKSIVFLPMAISFVAAGIIWKFMYDFQPAGAPQIGTVNAVFSAVIPGYQPQAWLFNTATNNIALIVVGIWMWTGFAMVILSAGIKGIPTDVLEAARIDGANEFQIFRFVTMPLLAPTITVVATTLIIDVLKIFDIVYVMTNGNLNTEVIANRMYKEMFNYHNYGRASAIAVILLVAIIPVMIMNIKRFRQGGANA
ncbi:Alpha-glucoside transport system permease protein AglF [uncultured spirochete]|jgi:alpha-glucoside transport system permease protein|uniref:Alpha-glucoside transport system permease protein AglF n=1 Tax=uncultured spirochete TaxID=156406 RepID=A0A3P3XH76_9SPIR|nr:Alpha-glucoside transport system permease protein AglF [uncultured spirochete]HBE46976.1 ABC transporter [Spirochaetaceae bacterium]